MAKAHIDLWSRWTKKDQNSKRVDKVDTRYKIQTWEKKSWLLSSVMVTGSVDCDGKNLWNDIQPQLVHTANQLIFVSELFSQ